VRFKTASNPNSFKRPSVRDGKHDRNHAGNVEYCVENAGELGWIPTFEGR